MRSNPARSLARTLATRTHSVALSAAADNGAALPACRHNRLVELYSQCEHSSVRPAAKPDAAGVPVCGLLLRRRLEARVVGLGLLREHELIDGDCTEVNDSA